MKFNQNDPPRCFSVGNRVKFDMHDCGNLALAPNEQVTFLTDAGGEYDVARKDWGFYATPSLNGRLPGFGLSAVLIRNTLIGRYFILLMEHDQEEAFNAYLEQESLEIIAWLDSSERLDALAAALKSAP